MSNDQMSDPEPEPVALDAHVALLAKGKECARAIKYWQGELDRINAELAQIMGDSEIGTVDGQEVLTYKFQDRFQGNEFRNKYPDMYRVYTRETTVHQFDLKTFRTARPDLYRQFQVRAMRNGFNNG